MNFLFKINLWILFCSTVVFTMSNSSYKQMSCLTQSFRVFFWGGRGREDALNYVQSPPILYIHRTMTMTVVCEPWWPLLLLSLELSRATLLLSCPLQMETEERLEDKFNLFLSFIECSRLESDVLWGNLLFAVEQRFLFIKCAIESIKVYSLNAWIWTYGTVIGYCFTCRIITLKPLAQESTCNKIIFQKLTFNLLLTSINLINIISTKIIFSLHQTNLSRKMNFSKIINLNAKHFCCSE